MTSGRNHWELKIHKYTSENATFKILSSPPPPPSPFLWQSMLMQHFALCITAYFTLTFPVPCGPPTNNAIMEINNSREREKFGGTLTKKYILPKSEMNWKLKKVERYRFQIIRAAEVFPFVLTASIFYGETGN